MSAKVAEASSLCGRGVAAYCRSDSGEALLLLQRADKALVEAQALLVEAPALAYRSLPQNAPATGGEEEEEDEEENGVPRELRMRVWRYLAYAAVAEQDWAEAEAALRALVAANARAFPFHRRALQGCHMGAAEEGSVDTREACGGPHLDSALAEADLARVRLRMAREHGASGGAEEAERPALALLAQAQRAVGILCGEESDIFARSGEP